MPERSGRAPWLPILVLLALGAAVAPAARLPGPEMPGITSLFAAILLATELCAGFLLLVRYQEERTLPLLVLGAGCLFSAGMAVAHLLTFAGALLPGRNVLGTTASTAWVFLGWITLQAMLALLAVVLERLGAQPLAPAAAARALWAGLALAFGVPLLILLAAVQLAPGWPALLAGLAWTGLNTVLGIAAILMLVLSVTLILAGPRRPLFDWLALSLTAQAVALTLSQIAGARYSLGWTAGRVFWLLSACLLLLYLLGEFTRQQARLSAAKAELEGRVAARTRELRDALGQRSLLLREVYHRVKNNLQTVDALLAMEARRLSEAQSLEAVRRLRERIQTLGLVHAQLMASADHETLDLAPFLHELAAKLRESLGAMQLELGVEPMRAGMDLAVPLGLVVTELVTNAVKHGTPPPGAPQAAHHAGSEAGPMVQISLAWDGQGALLRVSDRGGDAGAPERLARSKGLGLRLVRGLVRQLNARMAVEWQDGLHINIHVPPRPGLLPPSQGDGGQGGAA